MLSFKANIRLVFGWLSWEWWKGHGSPSPFRTGIRASVVWGTCSHIASGLACVSVCVMSQCRTPGARCPGARGKGCSGWRHGRPPRALPDLPHPMHWTQSSVLSSLHISLWPAWQHTTMCFAARGPYGFFSSDQVRSARARLLAHPGSRNQEPRRKSVHLWFESFKLGARCWLQSLSQCPSTSPTRLLVNNVTKSWNDRTYIHTRNHISD